MHKDHPTLADHVPDPNATGAPEGLRPADPGTPGREEHERAAAARRVARGPAGQRRRHPYTGLAAEGVAHRAFAALADNVRDFAIFLMDRDGIITFWGEGARLIKWWRREQAEGSHLRMLYPDGGAGDGTAEAHLADAARDGEYIGEGLRIRSDGSTFWAGVSLTALRDTAGVLIGFAKVTRDLTARRAGEAAVNAARDEAEAARRQAEEANRAKSLFLATMSHEIRTPINAVMGYVDLLDLELAGPLTEQQRAQLGRIRSSNMHLLGIIDEVLDFSRLEAGRITLAQRAGRIATPVDAALQMVHMQAAGRRVELVDEVAGLAAEVSYVGDEDRVRQVLLILLSNAVKFTPPGGRITVSGGMAEEPPPDARLAGAGPWVYVRVEDTGEGIAPDRLDAIFEPFEQADMTLTRQHGGTGLGLSIAKRLAVLMAGDLTVRSEPGAGSVFFLWLPAAAESAPAPDQPSGRERGIPGPGLLQEVHDAVLLELDRMLHVYVARLRSDPGTPSAHSLAEPELEDHLATFLSDLAATFNYLQPGTDGEPVRDGALIQRTVAERHGAQRRRLGWSEEELAREFQILHEEVAAAIRRRVQRPRPEEVDEAIETVRTIISAAAEVSRSGYEAGERSG